jgi:hypothetical protein
MKSVRVLLPVALIALAPVLAACGGDDDAEAKDDVSTSSSMPVDRSTDASSASSTDTASASTSAPESSDTGTGGGLPAACDVVKKIDIATAYGVTPAAGAPTGGGAGCAFAAKNFLAVTIDLSDDCPSASLPTSKSVDVKGATSAMWGEATSDPFAAELVACTDGAGMVVELGFQPGYQHEGDPQAQTISLAETVLARL